MEEEIKKIEKAFASKTFLKVLGAVGIAIIALLIFALGAIVGFHKASFRSAWGENYYANFAPSHPGFGLLDMDDAPNAHGAIGKIIKLELPTMIVQDQSNIEKIVLIGDDTTIEKQSAIITPSDLNLDDFTVVIGSPNDKGEIEAKFIRVIPMP